MMKYPDSAQFIYGMAKRARKYYLGLTTITQDVEDFMATEMGKAIIQNSSMQILLKQSSAAIDKVADVFFLSEGEKHLLLSADVGQGLFFAGPAHAAMKIIASPEEHALATTKPQETQAAGGKVTVNTTQQTPPSLVANMPPQATMTVETAPATPARSSRPMFTVETVGTTKP